MCKVTEHPTPSLVLHQVIQAQKHPQGLFGILSFKAACPGTDDFLFLQKKNPAPLYFQTMKQDLREHNKSPFYRRNFTVKSLLKIIQCRIRKVLWLQPVWFMLCISAA